jgi:hypothetical protein
VKRWLAILLVCAFLLAVLLTKSQWDGDVTEAAAGPLAEAQGRTEAQVLPWRIEGDLLLFVFLAGGVAAGFTAGYYWRGLFGAREPENTSEKVK